MHFNFLVVAAKNYGRKNLHDIRSDAWRHCDTNAGIGGLIFYGHERRRRSFYLIKANAITKSPIAKHNGE